MAHEDSHLLSFNLSRSIKSTTRIPILFPSDYEVWAFHFDDYVLGIEEHGATIWQAMTEEAYAHTVSRKIIKTLGDYNVLLVDHLNTPLDEKNKFRSNIKAMRIIIFALPPDTFRLVSSCDTAERIWDRLKELYLGDADLEHSVQKTLLSEFGSFAQKSKETLDQTFNRYNHLLRKLLKFKLEQSNIEQKVTFLNGLRSEWKAIVSTVKAHDQFKSYTLAKLVGILRSHEDEVKKEVKVVSSMGSLGLVAKGKKATNDDSEYDISDDDFSREDKAMMVSNPKKFFKKNFSRFRNRANQGNFTSEKPKEESYKKTKSEEEKKLLRDSDYDCHYCHGKNHFAKECLLRKQNEKKEQVKDEAYYAQKIEEPRKKDTSNAKPTFMVQEDDEDGAVEVWSTDLEDEELRKPTHGRCLMVQTNVSEQQGYSTDGCQPSASCFAAKPVSEQVKECKTVVDKVHSILKYRNISSSKYDSELADLRYTVSNFSDSLKRTRVSNSNLNDQLNRVLFKNEERKIKIEALELELARLKHDVIYVKRDNLALLKQRNIFCLIAKRLYYNITQLHLDCDIGRGLHKMIFPFLEMKEDENDVDCYKCETIVSSEDVSDSYRVGLEKIESYIQSKEHKIMLKEIFTKKYKNEIKSASIQKHHSLCKKLNSDDSLDTENVSEFVESEMSEISVEDEIDCSVMRDEHYDSEWYIDSGCSRHMTRRKEDLREYRLLKNGGRVRYGNNVTG
ncbi:hypothetical protein L1887_23887 [Cichorium endivia]|nr:hypothetical protein L1887_23887 [Cichorium endivia]